MAPMGLGTNFERCCRLCAEEPEATIMIFSAEAKAMLLQNKLSKYLKIEVDKDDKLPKNICIKCCSKLQIVCEFIDTAQKAQGLLLNRCHLVEQPKGSSIRKKPTDDNARITEMEINVDPMMVLQNSEEMSSPNFDDNNDSATEDVTYLHDVDAENVTIKLIRRADNPGAKPFPCITCRRSFYTELALKNHSWIHINDDKVDKQFRCSTCDDGFDYKSDLIDHLKEHRLSGMTCQICGRIFRTRNNLAVHMAAHLSVGKSYTCKVCGRSYNTKSNLKTHSITHSNERPFQCHVCKKSFKRNQDLKFHINQHTGAKPYKCPFCEKSFASSGNCYSHRSRMHPGRRIESKKRRGPSRDKQLQSPPTKSPLTAVKGVFKYQCQLCEHSFMKRDNFTYHMYQHTGEKPFHCSFCAEKFVTRRGLLLHHDKTHPDNDRPLALLSKNALLK